MGMDCLNSCARPDRQHGALVIPMSLALYVLLAFALYAVLTERMPGASDFLPRWMGARALILRGDNPYSDSVTREIQYAMYGRPASHDEDQVAFAYPLYAAYLAAPLIRLSYSMAQALWMALLAIGVSGGVLALAVVNRVVFSPFLVAALALGALTFYPSVRGIYLGQYALISFGLIALGILSVETRHDVLAGILVGLSTVKPQPVILLVPVILFWAWQNKRKNIVRSVFATLAVLLGSSFLWVPTWLADFLNGLGAYAHYAPVGPPLATALKWIVPDPVALLSFVAISAVLLCGLARVAWRSRRADWAGYQWTLGRAALVTVLIAGRIGTPDQVFLLILWAVWAGQCYERNTRLIMAAAIGLLLIFPWWVFLSTLRGSQEAVVVTMVLPLTTIALLLATRWPTFVKGLASK